MRVRDLEVLEAVGQPDEPPGVRRARLRVLPGELPAVLAVRLLLRLGSNDVPAVGGLAAVHVAGAGMARERGAEVLTVAANTTLLSDNTVRTISNNMVVNGNFTFGGTANTHNLTMNGLVNLGAAVRTITVSSPQVTATLGGIVSGTAGGLTKSGDGVLVLTPQTTGALSAAGAASNATVAGSTTVTLAATAPGLAAMSAAT